MQDEPMTLEEGGGPPLGTAWTIEVDGDAGWSADLEHAAPVPCIGERVDFIDRYGRQHHYRVAEVIHTVQASASDRPPVSAERSGPSAIITDDAEDGNLEPPRLLRAGLPRVVVVPTD